MAELVPAAAAILDCCAAPGGKTLILAERNPGARIVACESSPQRLAQLQERLAALGDRVECRLADAAALEDEAAYDVVLADVPCSGTGTLGRNPEIRHRLQAEDLARQAERQRAILRAALRAVRPGGHVVYSTCSLEPEENEQVVAAVLSETQRCAARFDEVADRGAGCGGHSRRFGRGAIASCASRRRAICGSLPGMFESDGFFVAMIEKTV